MNSKAFFELTRETRAAQRAWFLNHRLSDLDESKRLERLLDAALREGLDPEETQLDLFAEKDKEGEGCKRYRRS